MAVSYSYSARDANGKTINGVLEAENERAAAAQLRGNGLFPVSISTRPLSGRVAGSPQRTSSVGSRPATTATSGLSLSFAQKVTVTDLAVFCRQMAVMIKAGLPILRSLSILADQAKNKTMKEALSQIYADVQSGSPLASAFSRHPKAFPKMMVFMIQAAEVGGALDVVLERLSIHYEKEKELQSKISQALMYPIVVSVVATGTILILIYFVLPQFASLFSGIDLPPQTRFLLWLPGAMRQYGLFVLLGIIAAVFGLKTYTATDQGAYAKDKFILGLPMVGELVRKISTSRFCRTLGTLVSSGISLLTALELVQNVISNRILIDGVVKAHESIRQGTGLAGPLELAKVFPSMVTQMIRVGEETGNLEEVLAKVADFYDSEVDSSLKVVVGMIEPVILVVMGLVAGTIVSSIIIPMFDMMGAM